MAPKRDPQQEYTLLRHLATNVQTQSTSAPQGASGSQKSFPSTSVALTGHVASMESAVVVFVVDAGVVDDACELNSCAPPTRLREKICEESKKETSYCWVLMKFRRLTKKLLTAGFF